ncbi:segregation and condensation protein A [Candidatus Termititenax persephonae]|uniref:Segregation and condensation protein A n=1 Tax=Candidatus Termititenax persephonae TaxID=2218525 RepID=A0A388TJW8_9BACT|nr:segregation and condensation protein A [Candidatus Termititenax persephonae]
MSESEAVLAPRSKDDFQVQLEVFEGPFDLLLKQIDEEKVGIFEVSISKITTDYLDYLHKLQELDLEISSYFLEVAAFLVHLKSKKLLPEDPDPDPDSGFAEEKRLFLERLIQYKAFKNLTRSLLQREDAYAHVHTREAINNAYLDSLPAEKPIVFRNSQVELLVKAFQRVWQNFILRSRAGEDIVPPEIFPVREKMRQIIDRLQDSPAGLLLSEFFQDINKRSEIIATFIAMLELVRQQFILIAQNAIFDDIEISMRQNMENRELEFDEAEYNTVLDFSGAAKEGDQAAHDRPDYSDKQ